MSDTKSQPPRMGVIVALHGLPNAGKDSVADEMVAGHGYVKLAFANALYGDLSHLFQVPVSFLRERESKQTPQERLCIFNCVNPEYRKFLRDKGEDVYTPRTSRYHLDRYGTDYMRRIDPMHWVKQVTSRLDQNDAEDVVISDLRAYSDFREYIGLRRFASYSGRRLLVVNLLREGAKAPDDHEAHAPLPPHAVDLHVINHDGRLSDAVASIVGYVKGMRR